MHQVQEPVMIHNTDNLYHWYSLIQEGQTMTIAFVLNFNIAPVVFPERCLMVTGIVPVSA